MRTSGNLHCLNSTCKINHGDTIIRQDCSRQKKESGKVSTTEIDLESNHKFILNKGNKAIQ